MADPLSIAATAIGLLKNTNDALNALRERSQRSKDIDIKEQINALYNNVLSLNEVISRLLDENRELKRQLEQQAHVSERPEIMQVGDTIYYYLKDGTDGPYCQPCYDDKGKLVRLSPPENWNKGVRRQCMVCNNYFYEKQMEFSQKSIKPFMR